MYNVLNIQLQFSEPSFIFQAASSEKLFITSPGWPNEENIFYKL
jgi:hypothetical protein